MDRKDAFNVIEALLEREGRADVLAVARDVFAGSDGEGDEIDEIPGHAEASARLLLENMADGLIVHRGSVILYANAAGLRMLGYPPGGLVGRPVSDIVHPDDWNLTHERIDEILHRSDAVLPLIEERLVRKDGSLITVEASGTRIVYEGKLAILATARDISTRKKMEAQLVVNDRLASLGRLAASVGHELNNPLAYVLGNVTIMERELARAEYVRPELKEQLSSCIAMIREGSERMRDIVHDLKMISRSDDLDHATADVQQILDVCVNLAEHDLRARAHVVRDYRAKVYVRGSSSRLGQVFLNVLTHVTQAIAPGAAETNEVRIVVDAVGGSAALVEIRHTGESVPREAVDRLFEPFFSAHPGGPKEGAGAGLSIAHGLVTAAGGTISAEPLPDRGMVFRVVLPTS